VWRNNKASNFYVRAVRGGGSSGTTTILPTTTTTSLIETTTIPGTTTTTVPFGEIQFNYAYQVEFHSATSSAEFILVFYPEDIYFYEGNGYNLDLDYCEDYYNEVCMSDVGKWVKQGRRYKIVGVAVDMPTGDYPWVGIVFDFTAWPDIHGNFTGIGRLAKRFYFSNPIYRYGFFSGKLTDVE
jgi:hypothetical protein